MKIHMYAGSTALLMFLHSYRDEGRDEPIVIEIFDSSYDPYDALAANNIIAAHNDLDITVRFQCWFSLFSLCIAGAVPKEKRWCAPSSVLQFNRIETMLFGTHDDIKGANAAYLSLDERIFHNVASTFDLEVDFIVEAAEKKKMFFGPELEAIGMNFIRENLTTPPTDVDIEPGSDAQEDAVEEVVGDD